MYADACPLIPHAAAELRYLSLPCQAARPSRQTVTWVAGSPAFSGTGNDAVSSTYPPGVKGYGIPSGGPYYLDRSLTRPATGLVGISASKFGA